jgi:ABC-type bacteriocin/lantibiotic exporter with double-glycine peptidase domain
MAKKFINQYFPEMPRVAQENSYYCGPAVLQMLFGFYAYSFTQQELVNSLNLSKKIRAKGITVQEIGLIAQKIAPEFTFWFKANSSIKELSLLVNKFKTPVGVEWQGVFDYPEKEATEDEDDDPGHIAIVTHVDLQKNFLLIADPDIHYAGKDRQFSLLRFERRWWDINEITDPRTQKHKEVDDYRVMFIITPATTTFPLRLKMEKI